MPRRRKNESYLRSQSHSNRRASSYLDERNSKTKPYRCREPFLLRGSRVAPAADHQLGAAASELRLWPARRSRPTLPHAWMPAEVRDGEDHCALGLHDEEHAEGKSVENRAADFAKDDREPCWPLLDSRKCRPEFSEELRPEAGPFALIPRGRFKRVEFCLRPNDQTRHLQTAAQAQRSKTSTAPPARLGTPSTTRSTHWRRSGSVRPTKSVTCSARDQGLVQSLSARRQLKLPARVVDAAQRRPGCSPLRRLGLPSARGVARAG